MYQILLPNPCIWLMQDAHGLMAIYPRRDELNPTWVLLR